MEQDRYYGDGPDPGLYGSDRDLFKRVWRRVMPEETEGYPIELAGETETSLALPNDTANSFAALPAEDMRGGENYPAQHSMQCLGADSVIYSEQLQEFICDELADWKLYLALTRWAGAGACAILSGIAADEYRHAKRLSTAYFLISGVRFWPDRLPAPFIDSYPGALRQRFFGEQQGEAAYLAAAAETNDPCLHELYLELAADEAKHSLLIRSILELHI